MKPAWLILASALAASPAMAQDIILKPLIEARLRYENVDQAGLPRDAEAATIRVRSGVQASPSTAFQPNALASNGANKAARTVPELPMPAMPIALP